MNKPYAPACERNRQPILDELRTIFAQSKTVLEIGSGTGQHAVFFAEHLPWLNWQCSDQAEYLPGIQSWVEDSGLDNVKAPLLLDVNQAWPMVETVDAIFTANTLHIMSWPSVQNFFTGVGQILPINGKLVIYGPFNYEGRYTSDSNAEFDLWLKARDPESAIRDIEAIQALAMAQGLILKQDIAMPANNRLLLFTKRQ